MRKPGIIFLLLLVAATVSAVRILPQSDSSSKKKPDLIAYTGFDAEEGEVFASAFKKYAGSDLVIEVRKVSTGKLVETLQKSGEDCEAFIMFGGSLPAYLVAADQGLFMEYMPPEAKKFDKKFRDAKGRWIGIYVGVIGFAVNESMVESVPESWDDLLAPELKGKVVMADPGYSGTAYITLSTLAQLMGEDKGFEYMKKLDAQVPGYPKSGSEPAKMAGRGSVAVGISFAHDILRVRKDFPNLALSFPKEGTGLEIGGAAIPLHSPNPELAKKFMDFLASPAAQNLYGTRGIPPRFPTHPDAVHPEAALTRGKTLKIIDFDFSKSAVDEQRLKKRWAKEILEQRKHGE